MLTSRRVALLLCAAFICAPSVAHAWSQSVHQEVLARTIDTLPSGLKSFYKAHKAELPSLAPDSEPAEESADERFMIDLFEPFPFDNVPYTEAGIKAKYPEQAARAGRLPWLIQECYLRLVQAFRGGDKEKILAESDTMARLAANLRNPLALSQNFDGDKTRQGGLWARFTARLPEANEGRIKWRLDDAHLIEVPKEHSFAVLRSVYVWLDNLLYLDELAKRGNNTYSESFYEQFGLRAGEILGMMLSAAVGDAGSYWYTAWSEAGRPALK